MKDFIAKIIFIFLDAMMIFIALSFAYHFRSLFDTTIDIHTIALSTYTTFYPIYIIPIALFAYEGIYTYRYDFWHESRLILKAILFSAILVFAYLAMTKSIEHYSRLVIGFTFLFMSFLIPLAKNISKKILYKVGIWRKKASIYGDDPFLTEEIYQNPYLGYEKPAKQEEPATIFVNSKGSNPDALKRVLSEQIKQKHEVIFIPLMDDYDLTHSHIYELANTRTNLIVYKNRLKSRYRRIFQQSYNYLLAVLLLPFILPTIAIFALLIKRESKGPVFFVHERSEI